MFKNFAYYINYDIDFYTYYSKAEDERLLDQEQNTDKVGNKTQNKNLNLNQNKNPIQNPNPNQNENPQQPLNEIDVNLIPYHNIKNKEVYLLKLISKKLIMNFSLMFI